VYGWHSDNSVFLEDAGVYLRPGVYSVVVLEESPCLRGSSRTNFQVLVLVLVLGHQVLVLVLALKLDSLSLSSSLNLKSLTIRLAVLLRAFDFRARHKKNE